MKKQIMIVVIVCLLFVSIIIFFSYRGNNNLKTNKSVKNNSSEKVDERIVTQPKEEINSKKDQDSKLNNQESDDYNEENKTQPNQKSNNLPTNSDINSQSDTQSNNSQPDIIDSTTFVIDENDIFYPIHKGNIDYNDSDSCYKKGMDISFKYSSIISYYNCIDVMGINKSMGTRKVMGYYLEYIFANTSYKTLEECNNKGNSLKNDLSSKVSSYKCVDDNNNYILKVS